MIDRATVEKIKDAANIVDVVSEFVTLRKAGANYKGLCPFHNEKTPSFIVSPARGTCHCFGCGKGGDPISFMMEHEQMSYLEALRWLANKYHIEVHEREMSDEERREQNERESMFIVNDWAASYFEHLLHNHRDGMAVGMQYFRSRGFRDDIIRKFRLGFDLPDRFALAQAARDKGYQDEFLVKTGICYRTDRGELIDRYAGRVLFPWIGVSGKVVGFSARVLDSRTKGVAQKYVNSPESEIYKKDHELYGIYQAKKAIAKEDRVFMVEGQADVISMHQCGIENVVANSGTALSTHQIHMLHRFTSNITLLYDGDAAGIHAAMRGTDMLLSEGMNLKVMLLPDGDDPDSFARKHTADDFRKYIDTHQTDFMQFKTDLLLRNETDPIKRSEAINSIVASIAVVQNPILRDTYLHDCAQRIGMNEATLVNTMNRFIRTNKENQGKAQQRELEKAQQVPVQQPLNTTSPMQHASKVEQLLVQLIIRQGEKIIFRDIEDENGGRVNLSVAAYIAYSLGADGLKFSNDTFNHILQEAAEHAADKDFKAEYYFIHHHDIDISRLAASLAVDRYEFLVQEKHDAQQAPTHDVEPSQELPTDGKMKVNAQDKQDAQEAEHKETELRNHTIHLILDFRMAYVKQRLKDIQAEIVQAQGDMERLKKLMLDYKDMQQIRDAIARQLGNHIIV